MSKKILITGGAGFVGSNLAFFARPSFRGTGKKRRYGFYCIDSDSAKYVRFCN